MIKIFTGTYSTEESLGIYSFEMDENIGLFSPPHLFSKAGDSKYLWAGKNCLVSAVNMNGKAGVCFINYKDGSFFSSLLYEKNAPCYVSENGNIFYSANFHDGSVMLYDNTPKLKKRIDIAPFAGCHQVIVSGDEILVPCMNLDVIKVFSGNGVFIKDIVFPKNSGPRHGLFAEDGSLFVVGEKDNRLYKLINNFEIEYALDILSQKTGENTSAAIRLHPNKKLLYISTRGANIITVFDISNKKAALIEQKSCGGDHPRDFFITPNGKFLVAANRFSNEVVSIKLNENSGLIESIADRVHIVEATALAYKFC